MDLPVIDLEPYLLFRGKFGCGSEPEYNPTQSECDTPEGNLSPELQELCEKIAQSLREAGALIVKDPRCPAEDNDRFLDMMERYFKKSDDFKRKQERPDLHYQGPHLLAPTGSDLARHGKEGIVFAGYHYDLNFLTIHGRSRFPGLFIWLRNGQKVEVSVPPGCLLIQAGKELEWLTGGECLAGMHEVVVSQRTLDAIKVAHQAGRSLWRVSSTVFGHIASDAILEPLGHFASSPLAQNYPAICAGDFVELELAVINLKRNQDGTSDLCKTSGLGTRNFEDQTAAE